MRQVTFMAACVTSLVTQAACGGGPHFVHLKTPVRWDFSKGPIEVTIYSTGRVSAARRESDFVNATKATIKAWSVPSSTVAMKVNGPLRKTVDVPFYRDMESDGKVGTALVWDADGELFRELLGKGQERFVSGWSRVVPDGARIQRFFACLNGHLVVGRKELHGTLAHEIGHGLGLDHSQITSRFATGPVAKAGDGFVAPLMFPVMLIPPVDEPRGDDLAWLSWLYPAPGFKKIYGRINGRLEVKGKPGVPLLGANVVAVDESRDYRRFSCVSDYLNDGSGSFTIPVPPGKYWVYVEPIQTRFRGDSRVGAHARDLAGHSFKTRAIPNQFMKTWELEAGVEVEVGVLPVNVVTHE